MHKRCPRTAVQQGGHQPHVALEHLDRNTVQLKNWILISAIQPHVWTVEQQKLVGGMEADSLAPVHGYRQTL